MMELVEEVEGGFSTWFWKNQRGEVVSPRFDTRERANEWYGLHECWLERPAILEPNK